jgi:pyruvate dehydrogenase E1 component alpha subunit
VEHVKNILLEHGLSDGGELKAVEKEAKADVNAAIEEARRSPQPPIELLWHHVYANGLGAKLRPVEMGKAKISV